MKIKTKSFLRIEEYKALSGLSIDGHILDVGGSKKSGYHEIIKGKHRFTVGNINPEYGIDIVFDAQKEWPLPDEVFEGVLLVNVLEHLFDYDVAIKESFRVLKQGGKVAGVVPFMFNVHGSPHDFFRYTRLSLGRLFSDNGFSNIKIKELGTGAFSVIYHNLIGFVRWYWLSKTLIPLFKFADLILSRIKPDNKMSVQYMPLGYYFEVQK